jgi:hypothetical protein
MKFTFLRSILASVGVSGTQTTTQTITARGTTAAAGTDASTDACAIMARMQEEGEVIVGVPSWHQQGNIVVTLAPEDCGVVASDTWNIAQWSLNIVQIAPNQAFVPPTLADDERQLVKILRGSLIDVNVNGILKDGHWHTFTVTTPNRAIPLYIDSGVTEITAGDDGAVITYWTVSEKTLATPATNMTVSPITDISGPYTENLKWIPTGDLFGDKFKGVEFWNLAGIFVQENDGSRLMNMQWWTFGEDFDADAYHDHSDLTTENTFGEIHMTMFQGSSVSGMQTTLPATKNLNWKGNPEPIPSSNVAYEKNDQTEVQIAMPMPPGFAHGPLWSVDPSTGKPTRSCNGGVKYPFHRTLVDDLGPNNSPLRYTLWVAFEHVPKDVTVPLEMITEWPNANLQTSMTSAECDVAKKMDGEGTEVSRTSSAFHCSAFLWTVSFAFIFWN